MSTYVTTGLVLQVRAHQESSRLYTIYTRDFGKIEVMAAGSLKISSKLSPHLLPLNEVEIMVAHGKVRDRLAGAKLLRQLVSFTEPQDIILGEGFLEVVAKFTGFGQLQANLYDLLINSLLDLKDLPRDKVAWRDLARQKFFIFTYEVLKISGLAPNYQNCEVCHEGLSEETLFDWQLHGFVHNRCLVNKAHTARIDKAVQIWLTKLSLGKIGDDLMPSSALIFLNKYVAGQIGHELATLKVLKSVM